MCSSDLDPTQEMALFEGNEGFADFPFSFSSLLNSFPGSDLPASW